METARQPLKGHLVILILFFLFVLVAASGIYYRGVLNSRLPVLGQVGAFEFTERGGQPFALADLKGRVSVLDFFFTNCSGPCPAMSSRMASLYREFSNEPTVRFVSISVDPERDSLAALEAYARRFGVEDERWVFLRAPMREVHALAEGSFMLGGELPSLHSTKFILVDREARIRGYYSSDDSVSLDALRQQIRRLAGDAR